MNKVLIVDDEQIDVDTTAMMVTKFGFKAIEAISAVEALKLFHKLKPGIVITDLNLGEDMDGVALCSKIQYEDRSTVVMAMSGFFNDYDKIYCLAAGFSDFLIKPVDASDLHSALQCAFDRRSRWLNL